MPMLRRTHSSPHPSRVAHEAARVTAHRPLLSADARVRAALLAAVEAGEAESVRAQARRALANLTLDAAAADCSWADPEGAKAT